MRKLLLRKYLGAGRNSTPIIIPPAELQLQKVQTDNIFYRDSFAVVSSNNEHHSCKMEDIHSKCRNKLRWRKKTLLQNSSS